MPQFFYRALQYSGAEVHGELTAADESEAVKQLQATGSFPIEVSAAASGRKASRTQGRQPPLPGRELVLFVRQLASLAGAGITLDRALTLVGTDGRRTPRARLAERLLEAIRRGERLSRACAAEPTFQHHHAMMIAAGEARGDVGGALERLATVLERRRAVTQSLTNALVYPVSVLVVAALSISFLLGFVIPRFEGLFTSFRHAPPLAMRLLLGVASAFNDYGPYAAAVAGLACAAIVFKWRDAAFRALLGRHLLSLPLIGPVIGKIEAERMTFLLGSLIVSGITVPNAVAATRDATQNETIRAGLATAALGIERGERVTPSLAAIGVLPEMALEFVRVGEETGELAPMLLRAGEILRKDVETTLAELISLITPVSTVALGLIIGVIALIIFGAILEVYDIAV
ncbi:MAG: type II secretion system F family protein [Alphaproteobacteria bacterium]|nr:type II secretion system F family protein [Alphaproteobacteria bacterium]